MSDDDILNGLREAVREKADADRRITTLLVQARSAAFPIPLRELSNATGLTESGVCVRVRRARAPKSGWSS